METIADIKGGKNNSAGQSLADYELLSSLFVYPDSESVIKRIKEVHTYLSDTYPEQAEVIKPFIACMEGSTLQEMQELFLRSFDVQAITTLDIGFTLFGEDYKRGQLLVHLNREHREAGNTCHTELSDHLPNVLRLLPKMKDHEMRNEIALRLVIPAIEKMLIEFDSKKIEKKDEIYKKNLKTILDYLPNYRTVYQFVLQALFDLLKNDFGYIPGTTDVPAGIEEQDSINLSCSVNTGCSSCSPTAKDFSGNIEIEMNIEKY